MKCALESCDNATPVIHYENSVDRFAKYCSEECKKENRIRNRKKAPKMKRCHLCNLERAVTGFRCGVCQECRRGKEGVDTLHLIPILKNWRR